MRPSRSPRCQKCSEHHRKASTECHPWVSRRQTWTPKGKLQPPRHSWHTKTCDHCRRDHKRCEPNDRVWPEKCHRCTVIGHSCSPARTVTEQAEYDARAYHFQPQPQPQQLVTSDVLPSQHIGSSFMLVPDSSSDSDSNTSVPAVLPTSSKPEISKDAKWDEPNLEMKNTIQDMEAEFADVLKSEQARFEKIINELKAQHEKELKQQRDRYEGRIDDLIQILKKIK
ncbi:hypothetical protein F4810DRAFT_707423 [Camillea tinctor]|nr:hypothetical protein F4810DRAFT_707423 [Camillea tinctor]